MLDERECIRMFHPYACPDMHPGQPQLAKDDALMLLLAAGLPGCLASVKAEVYTGLQDFRVCPVRSC